ncbi:hypothetical protein [Celeribacter litoreus]|uniref:hypothetical protein n=1 Tax=Celeribacter litoreus TaxID=2876714 RepID=UPI001CC91F47|nr:hypothetical protein [Celeribacter litoreus]MCA0043017.1 hypothetical protein [Celeribacter litoreus]
MSHRFVICALGAFLGAPVSAMAQSDPLFHCHFPNGKEVTINVQAEGVSYAFGPPHAAPELQLERPYADVGVLPWNGVGRSIWEEIRIPNGDVTYAVWGSFDRMTEAHEVSGGIVVERGGEELARLDCAPSGVIYAPFSFSDVYEEAGYCWSFETERWQEACE